MWKVKYLLRHLMNEMNLPASSISLLITQIQISIRIFQLILQIDHKFHFSISFAVRRSTRKLKLIATNKLCKPQRFSSYRQSTRLIKVDDRNIVCGAGIVRNDAIRRQKINRTWRHRRTVKVWMETGLKVTLSAGATVGPSLISETHQGRTHLQARKSIQILISFDESGRARAKTIQPVLVDV